MPQRNALGFVILATIGLALMPAAAALPQGPKKIQEPSWSHAFDLACRNSTQPKFNKDTKKFGIEVFRDDNNGKGLYIIETGDIAAVNDLKDFKGSNAKRRDPEFMHGLDLKVRPAGIDDFAKAKVISMEVYRDENTSNWVYVSEVGAIAVAQGGRGYRAADTPKNPRLVHGLDFKVRSGRVMPFDKDTKAWSVEVFLDDNNGNLIYICENGMLAIVPGFQDAVVPTPKAVEPAWLHGLDLKVRKGGQMDFDGQTKVYGVEVFRDDNNGNLIYISETGSLSVVPGKKDLPAPTDAKKMTKPILTHGLDLKCRKFGQTDFGKGTPLFGVEVFNDDNTGCTVYICETGAISAVPKR